MKAIVLGATSGIGKSIAQNFIVRNKPVISLLSDALEKALDSLKGIKTDPP